MAVRNQKPTSRTIREIVKSLSTLTNEDSRFERLTATKDILSLVYGNADVYEQARNMLTGNNRLILEAGLESNINKRYKIVLEKLCELNELQFAVTANLFPPLQYYMLLKERCESCNDNAACLVLDERIKGDPDAEDEISRLGLLGLWEIEDNRGVGAILVAIGVITDEEFKRAIYERDAPVKPKETMHGCSICAGIFPESKCVKAVINQSEEWVCITDFERLEAEGKAIPAKSFVPGVEVKPPEPKTEKPPEEAFTLEQIDSKKKEIEERMEKLKTEKQTPEESTPETLTIKEESIIEPDATTLMYMEPTDYEEWRFGDFEGIIPGLEFEDLQELSDYVGLSEKMTEQEEEDIRALISKRINEIRAEGL